VGGRIDEVTEPASLEEKESAAEEAVSLTQPPAESGAAMEISSAEDSDKGAANEPGGGVALEAEGSGGSEVAVGAGTAESGAPLTSSADGEAPDVVRTPRVVEPRQRRPLIVRYGVRDYFFGDFVIEKGRFKILNFDGTPLLEVRDVELTVGVQGVPPEGGEFKAASASLFGRVEVENLRSPIVTDGVTLGLPAFECDFRGGTVKGRIETNVLAGGLPFLVGMKYEAIPMQLASDLFGGRIAFSGGEAEGQIQLLGLLRVPATYRGKGVMRVAGARLERNQFLGRAAPAAGVNALQGFEFEDLSVRFAVLQGQVLVEEVNVVSPDLSLSARGYVGLQGELNVAARVYVSERVYHGAKAMEDGFPESMGFGFRAFEGSSRFYRDYLVQGAITDPTIDFLENGSRMNVGEIREVLLKLSQPGGDADR
jgi:hypothetical protein